MQSFKYIKNWFRIKKLKKLLEQESNRITQEKQSEKYKALSAEEKEHVDQTIWDEYRMLDEDLEGILTEQLKREAVKYKIPIPYKWKNKDYEKYWEQDFLGLSDYLSPEGYHKLRKDIREERKARRDETLSWVPLVSGLSALGAIIAVVLSLLTFGLQQAPILVLKTLQVSEGQQRIYFYFQNIGNIGTYQLKGAYAITSHDEPKVEGTSNEKTLAFGTLDVKDEAFYPGNNNITLITKKVELRGKISEQKHFVYFSIAINYPRLEIGPWCFGKKGYKGVFMFNPNMGQWVMSTKEHLPAYFHIIFDALQKGKEPRFVENKKI